MYIARDYVKKIWQIIHSFISQTFIELFIEHKVRGTKIKKEPLLWDVHGLGVSNLLASLGHTRRRVVLDYTLNTQTLTKTDEQKNNKRF